MSMSATTPSAYQVCAVFHWKEGWPRSSVRSALLLAGIVTLGGFLACAPLETCVIVVAGTIGCCLVLVYPAVALYALAFAIPFGSVREIMLGKATVGASQFLLLGLVVGWFLRVTAFRQSRLVRSPLNMGLLCYLGTMVISVWFACDLTLAAKELVKWGEVLVLYLFVASELEDSEKRALAISLLLAGILQGGLGIYQFVHQVGPPAFVLLGRFMRAHGSFLQPNPFGGYMGLLLPLAYATTFTLWPKALRGRRRRGPWPILMWLLALLASAVMLAALVMSWSRGALVGFVFGAGLVALALGRRAWLVLAIIALVLLLLGPAWLTSLPRALIEWVKDMGQYVGAKDLRAVEITDENFSIIERLAHWQAAWRMFAGHPWLGVGTGQYPSTYPSVALPRWGDPLGHAHNYFLNVLAEGGLLGLLGYLTFVVTALLIAWRTARQRRGWPRALALGTLGMLGHLLAHSLFDNLYVHEMYLVVAILLGVVAALPCRRPLPLSRQHTRLGVP